MAIQVTTGAHDDLNKAAKLAYAIVTKLGMSSKIGLMGYETNEYGQKAYSDETAREIDLEVRKIIEECTEKTRRLLREYRDQTEKYFDLKGGSLISQFVPFEWFETDWLSCFWKRRLWT